MRARPILTGKSKVKHLIFVTPVQSSPTWSDLVLGLGQADSRGGQFRKLRMFYESCLDTDTIRTRGYQPAVDFIKQQFGSYLNPDLGDRGDLTDVIHG